MGLTTFALLVIIFLMLTTGVAATTTLLKNTGKDLMRAFEIIEYKINQDLQKQSIPQHYSLHT